MIAYSDLYLMMIILGRETPARVNTDASNTGAEGDGWEGETDEG